MDKARQKELKREYAAMVKRVARVLRKYAPINPADPWSDKDDYENYYGSLVVRLRNGASAEDLFPALRQIRLDHPDASANDDLDRTIAADLVKSFNAKKEVKPKKAKDEAPRFELASLTPELMGVMRKSAEDAICANPHPITQIVAGFEVEQGGWFILWFDRRAEATPDGDWTRKIEERSVEMASWSKILVTARRGRICIVDHLGHERLIEESESLSQVFGEWIVQSIMTVRDEGLFDALTLAPNCRFVVEDFNGHFGWVD